eukprot:s1090_g1.t2
MFLRVTTGADTKLCLSLEVKEAYATLGVSPAASFTEVSEAYKADSCYTIATAAAHGDIPSQIWQRVSSAKLRVTCYASERVPEHFLLEMAANIPAEVKTLSAQDACMKGLQVCVETIGGTTNFTCYSLYNLCKAHKLDFASFKKQVGILLPAFAGDQELFPWQRLQDLLRERVSPSAVREIDLLCSEHGQVAVFPPQWLRSAEFLLNGARSSNSGFKHPLEQELWVHRVCMEALSSLSCSTMKVLLRAWSSGEVDIQIRHSPSNPKMWVPVRKLLRIRQEDQEKRIRADVEEKLREAQSQVEAQAKSEEAGQEQLRNLWTASATASWGRLRATAEELVNDSREHIVRFQESKALKAGKRRFIEVYRDHLISFDEESLSLCQYFLGANSASKLAVCDLNVFNTAKDGPLPPVVAQLCQSWTADGAALVVVLPDTDLICRWEHDVLNLMEGSKKPIIVCDKDTGTYVHLLGVWHPDDATWDECFKAFPNVNELSGLFADVKRLQNDSRPALTWDG